HFSRYVRLWDAMTGQPIARIPQPGANASVFFSPDGKVLLTTEADQTARLWDATTGAALGPAWPLPSQFGPATVSPDRRTVLFTDTSCRTFWLCDGTTGSVRGRTLSLGGRADYYGFSPDGKTILTGSADGEARLWDAATLTPLGDPLRHPSSICGWGF